MAYACPKASPSPGGEGRGEGELDSEFTEGSPQGCGKLAGGNAPGNWHHMTLRPKGAPDLRPISSPGLAAPAGLAEIAWQRQLRQGGSPPHKPPHLDSSHPKSTVDLGIPALIWGDNALKSLQTTVLDRSKPLGIQGILTTFWTQTEIKPNPARKLFPTLDLGCLQFSSSSCSSSIGFPRLSKPIKGYPRLSQAIQASNFFPLAAPKSRPAGRRRVPSSVGKCRLVSPPPRGHIFIRRMRLSLALPKPLICKTNPILLLTMLR
jgi:hypothetical protein